MSTDQRRRHRAPRGSRALVAGAAAVVVAGGAVLATAPWRADTAAAQDRGAAHDTQAADTARTAHLPAGGLSVDGDVAPVHDPALFVDDDGTWYVFSTGLLHREQGGTILVRASHDGGVTWESEGTVWDEIPAWIDEKFGANGGTLPDNLWAPAIYEHDGTYYLYYSASTFGSNTSVTALATNTTLDPEDPDYRWVDRGPVLESPTPITRDGLQFNAIDPSVVEDHGTPYLSIGSFWSGLFLVPLEWPSGKPVDGWAEKSVHLVDRMAPPNAVEGSQIVKHGGYFYLFASFDFCCQAANSTYHVVVGRSKDVAGPYLDASGTSMLDGGGTTVLDKNGAEVGPGGQSVFGDVLAYHYYDASNAAAPYLPTLGLQKLGWKNDWPTVDAAADGAAVTRQPADSSTRAGTTATFTVGVTGTPAPVVTWQVSSDGGATWAAAPGSRAARAQRGTATLRLSHVAAAQDGLEVRARVRNPHAAVTSAVATLTVRTR
ncbi:glycoside hydrolase family 43 protein [Luteimicrobium sp. NPDC057192]|uniref:glycoside hydrolase family 43 protein n=1 Tax=Luteimicrobium sp. NPDC057192 TaxID=3346042 RepID=UPI00364025EF